jgi:predicted dehydrogenase
LLEADELAKKNGTGILAGLTYRYHLGRREAIERIHNGEIGEIVAIQCDFLRAPYRLVGRNENWSELEYQFRNWYHFTWLSGDDVPQSLVHNIDSALWAVEDEPPQRAYGLGGRSSQFQVEMGTSFDHHSVIFEYENGRRIYGSVRTSVGCFGSNIDVFHGTKGRCLFSGFSPPRFTNHAGDTTWTADKDASRKSPYRQEHLEFLQSIREGHPLQGGKQLAISTMTTVLGQMAVYSGSRITWEEAMNSNYRLPPEGEIRMDMDAPVKPGPDGLYPVAVPGVTKLL